MKNILIVLFFLVFNSYAQVPANFAFTPTSTSGTFYGQVQLNGMPASEGDWIAAFDSSGNCVEHQN